MAESPRFSPQLLLTATILAWGLVPAGLASGTSRRLLEALRCDEKNRADYERMERGYYEQLIDSGRRLDEDAGRAGWLHLEAPPFEAGPLAIAVDDFREFVLKPNLTFDHEGARWSTNAQGMRDRPYATAKPPGTRRIAFVGDSIAAGWGVNDGDGFEPLLEQALDERSRRGGGPAVEVLNFAVPGHGPGQRWDHFSRVGWEMGPDLVLFESTLADAGWDERRLRGLLPRGLGWDLPMYRDALAAAGVRPGGTPESYKRAIRPHRDAFLEGVYRAAVADCRARGIECILVLVPRVGKAADPDERRHMLAIARAAGFRSVIDLTDAYEGLDPSVLAIAPNDYHPNTDGHARLARRLEAALAGRPELRRLGFELGAGGGPRPTTAPDGTSEGADSP